MIYPENFEQKIEFDKIREGISKRCQSELGRYYVAEIRFSANFEEIITWLKEADEFLQIIRNEDFAPEGFSDLTESLNKIGIVGTSLELFEVVELRKSLDALRGILNFFKKDKADIYPVLSSACARVNYYPYVISRIDKIITKNGKIRDNASPDLLHIKQQMQQKNKGVTKVMNTIIKSARDQGIVDNDASPSIRNGRPVIPVNSSMKRRIHGIVHDESATGKTTFIEPSEVVELNNEIKELEYAERREIHRILLLFTDDIRPYAGDLIGSMEFLGRMDMIRAKAIFARDTDGIRPVIKESRIISWNQAKHPLLLLSLRKENRLVVPLNIQLNAKQRILLISGPNAGGKSVCLKTVGLVQYMIQCGCLVPMDENSESGIFDSMFIDIGDEQSIENDLSTYSSHLVNMKYFSRHADNSTLILIDEFGTGTEPHLGGAIAEAILENLNSNMVFGVLTTHYSNLKHFAASADGIENAAMLFDSHKMQPIFELATGQPGSSFAFEIARKIGIPDQIIKGATGRIGEEQVQFDKHLKEIIRDKKYWESKRDSIRKAEKRLQMILEQYGSELEVTEKARKEIISKAKKEAEELLRSANRRIENTIREIKEAQAEKDKTKEVREAFNSYREEAVQQDEEQARLNKKIEEIKEETTRVKERRKRFGQLEPTPAGVKKRLDPTIKEGDYVFLKGQDLPGEVLARKDNLVSVRFGQLNTKVDVNRLEKTSQEVYEDLNRYQPKGDYQDWDVSERKLHFRPEIDLRGKRVEEALKEVTEWIDEAILVDAREIRILHGKGDGILRQAIREYLGSVNLVSSFKDEHVQLGGAGITVVTLDS